MPVQRITRAEVPKATRKRISRIKRTHDWEEAVRQIRGADFEALMIEFAPETLKIGRATPDRFKRLLAAELRSMGLSERFRLSFRGKAESGAPILYVIRFADPKEKRSRLAAKAQRPQ
jgi:hypothetical protein